MAQPSGAPAERPQADASWDEHYRDERDAAYLYRALAAVEPDPERRSSSTNSRVVEDRHARALGGAVRAERPAAAAVYDRPADPAAGVGREAFRHLARFCR